jgi:opacity protein-like surface antigen
MQLVILPGTDTNCKIFAQTSKDTSYNAMATSKIINMVKPGKAPRVTISLSFNYDIGHLDLAANDNTIFRLGDFIAGRNFGTRYGYGVSLTGKFALHKKGNARLNATASYNRFQSNFVIAESPEGRVAYNVFGGALGIENNFNPDRKFKPYIGLDFVASFISGSATFITDSTDFNLKIKSSVRFGVAFNLGFEYVFNNNVGFNLGYKLTHANLIGKQNKISSNFSETYLNDEKLKTGEEIPFAGWKQFLYSSFYTGINIYIGMRNRK